MSATAPSTRTVFSARNAPSPAVAMGGWSTVSSPGFGSADIQLTRPEGRMGWLASQSVGALQLNHIALSGLHMRRTSVHLSGLAQNYVLALPAAGRSRNVVGGHDVLLEPRRIYLISAAVVGDVQPEGHYESFNTLIPVHLLRQRVSNLPTVFSAPLDGSDPRAELLGVYARQIDRLAGQIGDSEAQVLTTQLCDLVALMLRGDTRTFCDDRSLAAAHKQKALDCIESHYADEDLSAEIIARRCGISEGYLHRLFRDSGQSVMERLRALRLSKAREMLTSAALANLPISEIAYRNGFRSQSNFCRVFRQIYGVSPTQLRRH